ncbi:Epithelial cell-transforming sequence 2 oncogene-like [Lamellibrachia satsuma]|nr:Epithelial cell-transforming sequence 2 oncogene-like [Lamellibrachia satsuma]
MFAVTNSGGDDLQMTFHDTSIWGDTVDTFNFTALEQLAASDTRTPRLLTTQQPVDHPDRRSMVAREILASEINYMRTLDMIRRVFYKPLKAIVSAHNLKMIFSDILILLDLSREFVEDLRNRLSSWSADKCLGDLFVKFTGTLKVYVNFLNNYPVLLRMIERCLEQSAIFRAFLKRHERTVAAKMLTLPELLLAPSRRINEYVTLLTWFQRHTPPNHADRSDLQAAIVTFTELNNLSQEHKLRLERERELVELQKKIVSCPSLMEANRFFIKQLDVAHLKSPSRRTDTIRPEHRTYQHIEMLGLFLFNDSLVITRRTTHNFPFDRAVEHTYRFEACASLNRLRVEDIADSKYVTNALRMYTPKRSWVCGTDTAEDKFTWISVLEQNIRAALVD